MGKMPLGTNPFGTSLFEPQHVNGFLASALWLFTEKNIITASECKKQPDNVFVYIVCLCSLIEKKFSLGEL